MDGLALTIQKLSVLDGKDIYEMLQQLPANENGFMNPVKGKSYDEYIAWLKRAKCSSEQEGIIDGWKVPETTFWFPTRTGTCKIYMSRVV